MAIDRSIESLTKEMSKRVKAWLALCKKHKLTPYLVETKRSKARQWWLFSFGRWGKNKTKKPVTWTLNSNHLSGEAIDFVPLINGKINWNAPLHVWNAYIDLAEQVGLSSLYRKHGKDLPHLELNKLFVQPTKKMIAKEEALLVKRMREAWKALDEANNTKRYLAKLKGVAFHQYIITTLNDENK